MLDVNAMFIGGKMIGNVEVKDAANPLDKAVEYFGSPKKMAKALGVTSMAISHWHRRGVPVKRAIQIERVTCGEIKKEHLSAEFGFTAEAS